MSEKAVMDGDLPMTVVDVTTRILILQVAAIMTALFAALTTVLVVKDKRLKINKWVYTFFNF
ncbi:MAG TPA: hypothetical protein VH500_22715 [Nitrososphaeraceae archaeon]